VAKNTSRGASVEPPTAARRRAECRPSQNGGITAFLKLLLHVDEVILHDLLLVVEVLGLEVELVASRLSLTSPIKKRLKRSKHF
jgi:hypothetical protein